MADRMTNVEIEDVLSSIRRLVSEDIRTADPRVPTRLVLTPAQRVSVATPMLGPDPERETFDPVAQEAAEDAFEAEQALAASPFGGFDPMPQNRAPLDRGKADEPLASGPGGGLSAPRVSAVALEARIAELEAMISARGQEFEPDEGDPFGTDNRAGGASTLTQVEPVPVAASAVWASDHAFGGTRATAAAEGAATPEKPSAMRLGEAERVVEGDAPVVAKGMFRGLDLSALTADPDYAAAYEAKPSPITAASATPGPAITPEPIRDDHFGAVQQASEQGIAVDDGPQDGTVAAGEAAVECAGPSGSTDPDVAAPAGTAETAEAIAWDDVLSVDGSAPGEADEVIDEAMLRELVRDILREELQGPLGDRITRNVRKLVRAEINRALASRNFD